MPRICGHIEILLLVNFPLMTAEGLIKERKAIIKHDWHASNMVDPKAGSIKQISVDCCLKKH